MASDERTESAVSRVARSAIASGESVTRRLLQEFPEMTIADTYAAKATVLQDGAPSPTSRASEQKDGSVLLFDRGGQGVRLYSRPMEIGHGTVVDPGSAGVALRGPSKWADGTKKTLVWLKLAYQGKWDGHASGAFELNDGSFADIVQNFNRRGLPLPIDMEHASEAEATDGTIPTQGAPAHGWVHRLDARDGTLHGLVEWLDYAREGIRAGSFQYLSPAIRFGSRDPVTGKPVGPRLTSVAITNTPFLSQLPALIAARCA